MPNTPIVPLDETLSVLDISILQELIGDDQAVTNELLQGYLESSSHQTTRLMAAWQQHDLNEIEMLAHKLKSSSRSVGALKLGELCVILELAVRSNRLSEMEACLHDFAALFALTKQHIEQHLGPAADVPGVDVCE